MGKFVLGGFPSSLAEMIKQWLNGFNTGVVGFASLNFRQGAERNSGLVGNINKLAMRTRPNLVLNER